MDLTKNERELRELYATADIPTVAAPEETQSPREPEPFAAPATAESATAPPVAAPSLRLDPKPAARPAPTTPATSS